MGADDAPDPSSMSRQPSKEPLIRPTAPVGMRRPWMPGVRTLGALLGLGGLWLLSWARLQPAPAPPPTLDKLGPRVAERIELTLETLEAEREALRADGYW